jgi:hypothetical protein
MTRLSFLLSATLFGTSLAGCADPNRVTFVTMTNIAIDADATTQSASIGYDRYEGYVGPAYESGAVPPIVAKIKSNLSVLNPEVHQFYATGQAAILATCQGGKATDEQPPAPTTGQPEEEGTKCPELPKPRLSGNKRIMFFGTGSVIGLKVRWAGNAPESVTLGYKRKEFSTLPIGRIAQPDGTGTSGAAAGEDSYGSVLASLDMGTQVVAPINPKLSLGQFFATGDAAENLANKKVIRDAVRKELAASTAQSLQIVDVSSQFTPEGELKQPLATRLQRAIVPDPNNPKKIDLDALTKMQGCMKSVGAPSAHANDLLMKPDLQRFQEPVAKCMGLS